MLNNNSLLDLWDEFINCSFQIINKAKTLSYYDICENNKPDNQFGENREFSESVGVEVTSFDFIQNK